jgi:predicted branched-subunit amino acid permease
MISKLRIAFTVMFCLLNGFVFAQDSSNISSASGASIMMSHDKIYVVMAVCITILAGLFLYLIRIDTKVSKKEKLS